MKEDEITLVLTLAGLRPANGKEEEVDLQLMIFKRE